MKGTTKKKPPKLILGRVLYLDNMAEFGQQSRQGAGVVVLKAQTITKSLAVLCEQLADRKAGVFLSPKQLDQLSRQSLDTLHFCQSQHFLLTTLQHLTKETAVKLVFRQRQRKRHLYFIKGGFNNPVQSKNNLI